ncbi:MAG: hypothetical protein LBH73_08825 [Spirochaetaceae bacterium]|nr:hypothetical protein [Spirochaetaceae bacterium]
MKGSLLIERLKERGLSLGIEAETLERLVLALAVPSSFDELEEALPPAIRYLGPGIWAETIERSGR